MNRGRQLAARRREVERVRAGIAHAEGLIERQREVLGGLTGRRREWFCWNLRRQERQLKLARRQLKEMKQSVYAIHVLKDFDELDIAPDDEEEG